jgi:hypothetical protein
VIKIAHLLLFLYFALALGVQFFIYMRRFQLTEKEIKHFTNASIQHSDPVEARYWQLSQTTSMLMQLRVYAGTFFVYCMPIKTVALDCIIFASYLFLSGEISQLEKNFNEKVCCENKVRLFYKGANVAFGQWQLMFNRLRQ